MDYLLLDFYYITIHYLFLLFKYSLLIIKECVKNDISNNNFEICIWVNIIFNLKIEFISITFLNINKKLTLTFREFNSDSDVLRISLINIKKNYKILYYQNYDITCDFVKLYSNKLTLHMIWLLQILIIICIFWSQFFIK